MIEIKYNKGKEKDNIKNIKSRKKYYIYKSFLKINIIQIKIV